MSIQFSDTTNLKGLVQTYERMIGADYGYISGDTTRLKSFTAEVNLAMDDFVAMAIKASGSWEFDDSNQTDYPIIYTNIVSGQRDYPLLTDNDGNLILDIYKVTVAQSNGQYTELKPIDIESRAEWNDSFTNGLNITGVPWRYDKLGNAILLDPIPNYNYTAGLKIYVNREATYFTSTDTTKKPGVPGLFHRYFALVPAYRYASQNGLSIAGGRLRNGAYTGLLMEIQDAENEIKSYFGRRSKDERQILSEGNWWTKNRRFR